MRKLIVLTLFCLFPLLLAADTIPRRAGNPSSIALQDFNSDDCQAITQFTSGTALGAAHKGLTCYDTKDDPGSEEGLWIWNGTAWAQVVGSGGGTPGGSDKDVQVNVGGSFGNVSGFTANTTSGRVSATEFAGPLVGDDAVTLNTDADADGTGRMKVIGMTGSEDLGTGTWKALLFGGPLGTATDGSESSAWLLTEPNDSDNSSQGTFPFGGASNGLYFRNYNDLGGAVSVISSVCMEPACNAGGLPSTGDALQLLLGTELGGSTEAPSLSFKLRYDWNQDGVVDIDDFADVNHLHSSTFFNINPIHNPSFVGGFNAPKMTMNWHGVNGGKNNSVEFGVDETLCPDDASDDGSVYIGSASKAQTVGQKYLDKPVIRNKVCVKNIFDTATDLQTVDARKKFTRSSYNNAAPGYAPDSVAIELSATMSVDKNRYIVLNTNDFGGSQDGASGITGPFVGGGSTGDDDGDGTLDYKMGPMYAQSRLGTNWTNSYTWRFHASSQQVGGVNKSGGDLIVGEWNDANANGIKDAGETATVAQDLGPYWAKTEGGNGGLWQTQGANVARWYAEACGTALCWKADFDSDGTPETCLADGGPDDNCDGVPDGGGGGGTPGGADTQVQFNDAGAFGGDTTLTFNKTTKLLTVTGGIDLSGDATPNLSDDGLKNGSVAADDNTIISADADQDLTGRIGLDTTGDGTAENYFANGMAACTTGQVLKASASGVFDCGTDDTGSGGATESGFQTSTIFEDWSFFLDDKYPDQSDDAEILYGDHRWYYRETANGGDVYYTSSGGHPGIIRVATPASGGVLIRTPLTSMHLSDVDTYDAEIVIRTSGGSANSYTYFGTSNNSGASGEPSTGVYIRSLSTTASNGTWEGVCENAGTESTVSLFTDFNTTWHHMKIHYDKAIGKATFYVDGASQGFCDTNIPTAEMFPLYLKIVDTGGAVKNLDVDAMSFTYHWSTER